MFCAHTQYFKKFLNNSIKNELISIKFWKLECGTNFTPECYKIVQLIDKM